MIGKEKKSIRYEQSGEAQERDSIWSEHRNCGCELLYRLSLYRNIVKVTGTSGGRCGNITEHIGPAPAEEVHERTGRVFVVYSLRTFVCAMVVLRNGVELGVHNGGADNQNGGADNPNGGCDEGRIATLLGQKIARAFSEELPPMLDAFRGNVLGTIDACIAAAIAAAMNGERGRGQGTGSETRLRDFTSMRPPSYGGEKDPLVSRRWVNEKESAFFTAATPANDRVRFATSTLKDGAREWWTALSSSMTLQAREAMTLDQFLERFNRDFVPPEEVEQLAREYLGLKQTFETFEEITKKFKEREMFCPEYAATEAMKVARYKTMLKTQIREFVANTNYPTLDDLVDAARRRELEVMVQAAEEPERKEAPSGANADVTSQIFE
ncbi:hypothetical protein LXL04_007969 [Taraxacum kok-saghyz]